MLTCSGQVSQQINDIDIDGVVVAERSDLWAGRVGGGRSQDSGMEESGQFIACLSDEIYGSRLPPSDGAFILMVSARGWQSDGRWTMM